MVLFRDWNAKVELYYFCNNPKNKWNFIPKNGDAEGLFYLDDAILKGVDGKTCQRFDAGFGRDVFAVRNNRMGTDV